MKGFQRVHLDTGETATVNFGVAYEELAFWDAAMHAFRVDGGTYDAIVGNSSADAALAGQITANAAPKLLRDGKPVGTNFSLSRLTRNRFLFRFSGEVTYAAVVFTADGRIVFSIKNRGAGSCRWRAPSPGVYVIKVSGPNFSSAATVCTAE